MEYRTVTGVEIATVGMDWPASTGAYTCTFEHLADAMEAANSDPHVMSPRLKLGHTSQLNGELNEVAHDPFADLGDGAPAFGRVVNLRLENGGAVLVGDFIEVPAWLADAMPSAYPSRSTEVRLMYTTEGGKQYSAVITAVALLGPFEPAIKDLDDLERLLIQGPESTAAVAAATPEEGRMPEIDASVATGTIRERFNFDWAVSEPVEGLNTYWWWARDVRVDPNEIIADDDEGGIWSVSFETDGKDEVTFGEPVRVREEFVPVSASATAVIAARNERSDQRVLASNLERPEKPAPKTAASSQPDPQEDEMDIDLDKLRDRLGLPDDATEEQINEALAAEPTPDPDPSPDPDPAPDPDPTPDPDPDPEPVAASHGVILDKEAVAQLQSEAKEGREARRVQLSTEREGIVESAVKAGKFPPSAATSYRQQLDKGGEIEASTRKFIEELPDNTVPVDELGGAEESDQGWKDRVMSSFPGHKSKQAA